MGRHDPWWRQTESQEQLRAALEDILAEARVRRREAGRRGKGGIQEEISESGSKGCRYDGTKTGDAWVCG